ncbi:exported hypothetical protein [Sphingobacterium sp. PM2-P1-29]|nr:exported hypothetical protein [Sphingobacterium sp. PM2-P1-29]
MRYYLVVVFSLLFVLNTNPLFAQKGMKLDIVTISIDDLSLNKHEIPFDVPFYIQIENLNDFNAIQFKYGVKNFYKRKSWVSLPNNLIDGDSLYLSDEVTIKNNKAVLYCPGLHPNMPYNFTFYTKKEIPKDDTYQKGLKDKIADVISVYFEENALKDLRDSSRQVLYDNIYRTILSYIGVKPSDSLLMPNGERFKISYLTYEKTYDGVQTGKNAIKLAKNNIASPDNGSIAIKLFLEKHQDTILKQINTILYNESALNENFKKFLASPVDKSIIQFNNYTIKDGLEILQFLTQKPDLLEKILDGKLKIEDRLFVPTAFYDIPSVDFIISLVERLKINDIRVTIKGEEQVLFVDEGFIGISELLQNMKSHYKQLAIGMQIYSDGIKHLQSEIINIVIYNTFSQDVITVPEVETEKSPYISLETGIGGATGFSSAFGYYVANFYFVPVNKNASLSTFKGWNKFLKMFSVQAGVANFLSTRPENTYSFIGNNVNRDLMLGIGFRFTKLLRINAGTILYRSNQENPFADNYKVQPSLYLSAGIDINFLSVIKDAVKVFNL